jgi:beta-galactosidase
MKCAAPFLLLLSSLFSCLVGGADPVAASPRTVVAWDTGWLFSKSDPATGMAPGFDDAGWRPVRVPHDWSQDEPFRPEYGSGNGYAAGGVAWYRKHFQLAAADRGKLVTVEFDGVYDHAEIWLNGHFLGVRPYGYSSFHFDLTPLVRFDGENVLAVRVDHARYADSRYYTGSGIYRHVRLCLTDRLHIAQWGTFVTTPQVSDEAAIVHVETTVANNSGEARAFVVHSDVLDADGRVIVQRSVGARAAAGQEQAVSQDAPLEKPQRWSIEAPVLYTLRNRVTVGGVLVDQTSTPFGIRTIAFDPDRGFLLNGRSTKIKGVCIHHDAGSLGAAVPDAVLERRLRLLRDLGVNAIRTSHNPPAPELLDLCDRLGLLVMDEAFDEFTPTKNKWVEGWNVGQPSRYGYGESFAEWALRDVEDMVRRDRNHPCIVMWSIGNEVDYPNDPFSHPVLGEGYRPHNPPASDLVRLGAPLVAAVKRLDPTRPVTAALASVEMSDAVGFPTVLDVVGYNYQELRYQADHAKFPQRVIYGSENRHDFAAWAAVRDNAYIPAQFLWTGIDYLGEAGRWPIRGNGAGLLDLCGFKKPLAWFRQSLWSNQPMVYLAVVRSDTPTGPAPTTQGTPALDRVRRGRVREHWNWPDGSSLNVVCFANCAEVELTLNGRSLGRKRLTEAADGVLTWTTVPYEPGILRAVGLENGTAVAEFALQTAGPAARVELIPETTALPADGNGICHLEFRITDASGIRVPDATQQVTFEVSGPAEILGIGNGDLANTEDPRDDAHRAHQGRGLVILRSQTTAGEVRVRATAPGLEPGLAVLRCGE